MEEQLNDAQCALKLATTEYRKACAALHTPLRTPSDETNRLYMNEIAKKCDKFIQSTREDLLKIALALKTAPNQQARINRLPPELLVKVFQFDLDVHQSLTLSNTFPQSRLSRIASLSSVCSHWRKLAVETGSFWSHIPIHLPEAFVALCIERAKNSPLDIVATDTPNELVRPSTTWKGENALRDHAHNIHSLAVSASTQERICSPIEWALESTIPWKLRELLVEYTVGCWPGHHSSMPDSLPNIKLNTLAKDIQTLSLKGIHINWNECAFEKLIVLKLNGLDMLHLNVLEEVLLASPVLQVLELTNIRLNGARTNPKPLNLPNLRTLCLSHSEYGLDGIADMFEPGAYHVELDVNMHNVILPRAHRQIGMLKLQQTVRKMHNITVLGICDRLGPTQETLVLFSSVITILPDLTTLRLRDMKLGRNSLLALGDTLRALPQIKKIQIKCVHITDAETFKDVIENWSVKCIELISCQSTWNGTKARIEPGAPLYEWVMKLALEVSVSWE